MRAVRRAVAALGAAVLVAMAAPVTAAEALGTTPASSTVTASLGSSKSYRLNSSHVRWNPCAKIHYRVNTTYATAGALRDVTVAISRVEAATGLDFVYDGRTTVIPQSNYGGSGGSTPKPVVIAWAKPGKGTGRSDILSGGSELAVGSWVASGWYDETGNHPTRITTGSVVLDVASNRLAHGFGSGRPTRGGLLLHELGHVVGLSHVNDRTQIMNPYIINRATYGNGDKAGLAKLGIKAGCLP
ncbi:MAG: hypothetical protein JWM93_2225 [Frankiales bacterium]|nr:hypothetical protein [Frankiales bacterium]